MSAPARALVVDDSRALAAHLQWQLRALGLRADITTDADSALRRGPEADFIFVELQLLQGNGFELTRRLNAQCGAAVILLSGSGRATDRAWGLRAGARAVLTRPLRQGQLRECLRRLGAWRGDG